MFCKNCGTQLADGSKFCTACGSSLAAEAVQTEETPVVETPVAETPVAEAAAPEAPVTEEQPVFAQPWQGEPVAELPKKKSKKFLAWLIPSVAVVAVAAFVAIAAIFDLFGVKGLFLKSVGSAEDYRDYVQANTTKTATGTITKAYGTVVNTLSGETQKGETGAADVSVKLNVGDKAVTMLEDLTKAKLGEKIDMDWAKDVELKLNTNAKDGLQQVGATLNIGSKEIAVVDSILNMDEGMFYFAVLNLSDDYLAVDLNEYLPMGETPAVMDLLQDPELIAALPTDAELDALLNKYIGIAIACFDDVEKSTETVEIGDVKQKLTVLETTIDGDALLSAAEAVLKELAKDKQVEKMVCKVLEYAADQEELGLYLDADEAWETVEEGIDEALDALKDVDGDDMEGELILTQYVNNAHETVGYAVEVEDEQVVRFVEIKDGDKIAFELKVPNTLEIAGEGTEKKGVVNADYVVYVEMPSWDEDYNVTYEKKEVLTISLVDFKAEGNLVNGKIRLTPASDLLDELGLPAAAASAIDLAQIQLELGFDVNETSSTIDFNILTGEDLLVGVTLSGAGKEATAIDMPSEAYDIEDIEDWAEGIDVEKVLEALDEAGLPIGELVLGQQSNATVEAIRPIY